MDTPRTDTARDHDDSDIIDDARPAPSQGGTSGGNLARDVASQTEEHRVSDPEHRERPTKEDDIDNDAAYPSQRPRD
ncbi:MAG TPA: hypothetical protein VFT56_13830 [Sphingomonas sp.]|nr:hypothetical protein [Sphingomonas sp.]